MTCIFKVIHYCLQVYCRCIRSKCIKIYELDPAHFLSAPGLAWQGCLKTDIDILLMVAKDTRGGICQAIHRYAKPNNKYMKNYEKNIKSFKSFKNIISRI